MPIKSHGIISSSGSVAALERGVVERALTFGQGAVKVQKREGDADGERLFSGSRDGTTKVWDLESGKETLTLRGHTGEVSSLALAGDGKPQLTYNTSRNIHGKGRDAPSRKRTKVGIQGRTG